MAGKRLPRCCNCGRAFRPDRYNPERNRWCSRAECRRERDRARKRRHYHERLKQDAEVRDSERLRCRTAMRVLRARRRREAAEPAPAAAVKIPDLVAGLVSHLADTTDPVVLGEVMSRYAERGRRVALVSPWRAPP